MAPRGVEAHAPAVRGVAGEAAQGRDVAAVACRPRRALVVPGPQGPQPGAQGRKERLLGRGWRARNCSTTSTASSRTICATWARPCTRVASSPRCCALSRDDTHVFVVRVAGEPVAASITVGWRDRLEVPWASSLRAHATSRRTRCCTGRCCDGRCERGYRTFDFGRSTPDEGTFHFKKQWGAQPQAAGMGVSGAHGRGSGPEPEEPQIQGRDCRLAAPARLADQSRWSSHRQDRFPEPCLESAASVERHPSDLRPAVDAMASRMRHYPWQKTDTWAPVERPCGVELGDA